MSDTNTEGKILVPLTEAQYDFVLRNCDNNISIGYAALNNNLPLDVQEQIADKIDQFKTLKQTLIDAKL